MSSQAIDGKPNLVRVRLPRLGADEASVPPATFSPMVKSMHVPLGRRISIGNNLEVLAAIDAGSVNLVYLDPPFNSGRTYQSRVGKSASSDAFGDVWTWDDASESLLRSLPDLMPPSAAALTTALARELGPTPMAAYLVSIGARLGQVHRVLSAEGSLYVHVDPSASHYLKVVLDAIFGAKNFRNEIAWKRTHAHSGSRRYGPIHDTLLFYTRTENYTWNQQYSPYTREYIETYFRQSDERGPYQAITCTGPGDRFGTKAHYCWKGQFPPAGRHWAWVKEEMERLEAAGRLVYSRNGVPRVKRYVDDGPGVRLQDIWTDIAPLSAHSVERLGYDTQKPVSLLERVIASSSNEGDLVLDPYGGTGTTAVAAERLGRSWHTIDVGLLASSLTLARTRAEAPSANIELVGMPCDVSAARALLRKDPLAYGAWATALLATHLDGKDRRPDIATGTRTWGRRAIGLVPLGASRQRPSMKRSSRYGVGFVVEGPGHGALVRLLKAAGTEDVEKVPIAALVGPLVAASGAADIDLRLAP